MLINVLHCLKYACPTHDLMVEKGRHQRLNLSQRNCPFCFGNLLENESHLLLTCNTFSILRKELCVVAKQFIPRLELLSKEEQLKALLSDGKVVISTGILLGDGKVVISTGILLHGALAQKRYIGILFS